MSWAAWGQAEGWILKSSRVLTVAGHRPGSSSEPFPQTHSPWSPQQLECTDMAFKDAEAETDRLLQWNSLREGSKLLLLEDNNIPAPTSQMVLVILIMHLS